MLPMLPEYITSWKIDGESFHIMYPVRFVDYFQIKDHDVKVSAFPIRWSPIFRDELLDQIRTGVTLKKVSTDEQRQPPLPAEAGGGAGGGIAGMLQRALQERQGVLRFSSSEDEGSEATADDDDEWD